MDEYDPVQGRYAYGDTRCSCIAASAVTGLNTEPGGYRPISARSSDGKFFTSAVFCVRPWFASAFVDTRPAKTDGSYVGDEASARIDPSFGSSATIAPPRAAHWPLARARLMPY